MELDATGKTNGSGDFTSRIFDAGSNASWSSIAWTPYQPYLKELPDNEGVESAYAAGNLDMTNDVLLMHLNESSGATSFTDSSGAGNNGSCDDANSHCPAVTTSGRFNNGFDFDGGDVITVLDDPSLQITGDLTIAAWVISTVTTSANAQGILNKMYYDNYWGKNYGFSLAKNSANKYYVFIGTAAGARTSVLSNSAYTDTNWHHIAAVHKSDNSIYLYIDGVKQTATGSLALGSVNEDLDIGKLYGNYENYYWNGTIDEAVVVNAALTDTQILDMYKRGANRLQFQVRSCDDGACSGESFIGPDGSSGTYYSELTDASTALPSKTLGNVSNNRYFQYKAFLETSQSTISPALLDITLTYGSLESVPEFSSGIYVMTIVFMVFYIGRRKDKIFV
ncbi:MAG: hypothetical protein COV59_01530 [Candidatus Magasanikbacteria bacterium CG11_big_fil_rev_8_21_14_0_20_39_34]|uniref:LamG-like jellyroll fold domain-containing protein n=1 Tax=Candidatus Magasanikbacteria bacterium CG11_big_fil_rev_8_21_14_0_20_39_34 TaxID=1974653 RepID=A0A2H0N5X5_9BACT|nr:MAG: hypothetical protein COV59_01530 [Candidatus Magasanikbacteria bacterium CG11_big_fil_rev_8_21_14_0_20_39_34]